MILSTPVQDPIKAIVSWANSQDRVRAVILTSTRAIPGSAVDALSDYDVILAVQDIHPYVCDHAWLEDFGEVLVAYWDPVHPDPHFGIDVCSNVVQYCSGLKIDFTLWHVALLERIVAGPYLPAELDAGYRVLLDKDHYTDGLRLPTGKAYVPEMPSMETFETWVNDFLSDAPYVAKCLWRDELLPARWCLDADMIHTYLRRVFEWRVEIDHAWSIPVGALGKGLKKHLQADTWSALEGTFTGAGLEENWQALRHTMELFRCVSKEVGEKLGYPYPDTLHQRVSDYVEQIWRMKDPPDNG